MTDIYPFGKISVDRLWEIENENSLHRVSE